MKIAVLHWNTSSVGGINSVLQAYRAVAARRGDVFHVFASNPQRTKRPVVFPKPKLVRGGDSYILIDGEAPYHDVNIAATLKLLAGYDVVLTSFLCPHPTKAYGAAPLFLALLEGVRKLGKPLVGYIHDAYWDSYQEWGERTLKLCDRTLVTEKAYGEPLLKAGYKVTSIAVPFTPLVRDPKVTRNPKRLVWLPQWKNIKGVHKFFRGIPELRRANFSVGLYNNGIEYYKLRLTPEWKKTVDVDHFATAYSAKRKSPCVEFHGWLPLEEMPGALLGAGFMADFQGHAAKYEAYLNGSYNSTIVEALYYGCVPVVHSNMLKSDIPGELLLAVDRIEDYPAAVAKYPLKSYRTKKAREYVLDSHGADALYDKVFGGLLGKRR